MLVDLAISTWGELGLRVEKPGKLSPEPSLVGSQIPELLFPLQPAAPQAWVGLEVTGRGRVYLGKASWDGDGGMGCRATGWREDG